VISARLRPGREESVFRDPASEAEVPTTRTP
jgi:hypothetical protein